MVINEMDTLAPYSNSANLKAVPRQVKRTETREHASQKLFKSRSPLKLPAFTVAQRSSNASATADSGVSLISTPSSSRLDVIELFAKFSFLQSFAKRKKMD